MSRSPMSIWTLTLMIVVSLIWAGMFGAVAYVAAQKAPAGSRRASNPPTLRAARTWRNW